MDTDHLSNEEDLCYRRLLDLCYDTEKPLVDDINFLARRTRSKKAVVESILREFFRLEEGWVNPRVCLELSKLKQFTEAGRAGAARRWGKNKGVVQDSPPIESDMRSDSPPMESDMRSDSPTMLPITHYPLPIDTPLAPKGHHDLEITSLNRARMLFRMRESTPLDQAQDRSWKKNKGAVCATSQQDWLLLEWFYAQGIAKGQPGEYRRKDLAQLLNNWNGEISRAAAAAQEAGWHGRIESEKKEREPEGWRKVLVEIFDGTDEEQAAAAVWDELPVSVRNQIRNRLGETENQQENAAA